MPFTHFQSGRSKASWLQRGLQLLAAAALAAGGNDMHLDLRGIPQMEPLAYCLERMFTITLSFISIVDVILCRHGFVVEQEASGLRLGVTVPRHHVIFVGCVESLRPRFVWALKHKKALLTRRTNHDYFHNCETHYFHFLCECTWAKASGRS